MQQQIQLERNDSISQEHPNHQREYNHLDEFEMVNADEDVIEEDITQNYQQEFESISEEQNNPQEIKQDFAQIEQNIVENVVEDSKVNARDSPSQTNEQRECKQIRAQCKKLEQQITTLIEHINKYNNDKSQILLLQKTIKQNNSILQSIQAEQVSYFQNKMGRDSLTPTLNLDSEDAQENLVEQIDKLKVLINMSYLQVCRLKRETKKNEQMLPLQEQNQQQFYQRYNNLKRELQTKRQKFQQKQVKDSELQQKIVKLKDKIEEISSTFPVIEQNRDDEADRLTIRFEQSKKKKESEAKRINMLLHQHQNSSQAISRNIIQLRKQNLQYEQSILALEQRNIKIQQDSQTLMEQYQKNQFFVSKVFEKNVDHYEQVSPSKIKSVSYRQKNRKYRSQTKNSFSDNIFINEISCQTSQEVNKSNERYITKKESVELPPPLSTNKSNSFKIELSHESTSNTLKPFKLKLPSNTPKSKKNLNVSLDISKNTASRSKNRTDFAKLSIAQRLQRIQQLQKQDKMYSSKLYQARPQEIVLSGNRPMSLNSNKAKDINSAIQLPLYQKQMLIAKKQLNNLPFDSNLSFHATNQSRQPKFNAIMFQNERKQEQTQSCANTPQLSDRLNHKIFKKRIIYRQKKISEEYMKVLEQRGRKILQLDNQSEN